MLKGIINKKEIKKYRTELQQKLELISVEKIPIKYSSKAVISPLEEDSYSEDYKMWWYFGGGEHHFWNPYGEGRPSENKAVTGRCQINMSMEGLNRRIGGAFAKDEDDELYLLHNGSIGGGVTGVSKKPFLKWYPGSLIEVDFEGQIAEYFIIAEFRSINFYEQIQFFVNKVYEFKKTSSQTIQDTIDRGDENNWLTHGESILRNPYHLSGKTILRGANHAIITNELIEILKAAGHDARRNKLIDTFIVGADNKLSHIFEVKSKLNTQSLYTAIGQLMIYGISHNTNLIMVVDENSRPSLIKDLAKLNITCLTFSWIKKKPIFKNLSALDGIL
ncbi:MAG: hypothetical protein JWR09_3786 [Mucilaginibacter sp.]|nr:hypothetical protein [Mucilaginibacter sp.]